MLRSAATASVCLVLHTACGGGGTMETTPSVEPPAPEPFVVTSFGMATGDDFVLGQRYLAFAVDESEQGFDVNGDGGAHGNVLHVYDMDEGVLLNTALGMGIGIDMLDDRWVFFTQPTNLHLQVYDIESRTVRDLALPAFYSYGVGDRIAFTVTEPRLDRDLNGDGDTFDQVLHTYEPARDRLTNLELASIRFPRVDGTWSHFRVDEARQGEDLNGDGDLDDWVAYALEGTTGRVVNSKVQAERIFLMEEGVALFDTTEEENELDLNDDGDLDDFGMVVFDAENERIDFHADFKPMGVGGVLALCRRFEGGSVREDLNSDGDEEDWVVHTLDLVTGVLIDHRIAVNDTRAWAAIDGDRGLLLADEVGQGHDLNGDGRDDDEAVLLLLDLTSSVFRPISVGRYDIHSRLHENVVFVEDFILFHGDDFLLGTERELLVYDIPAREFSASGFTNTFVPFPGPVEVDPIGVEGTQVVIQGREARVDLNGNGQVRDTVAVVFDAETGAFLSTRASIGAGLSGGLRLSSGRTAGLVSEHELDEDLNGDGSVGFFARVLHVVEPAEPSEP